ncbi:MAG: hypothetical protein OXM57_14350 [bacterium]|nr:hypothetical protein [bacterium]
MSEWLGFLKMGTAMMVLLGMLFSVFFRELARSASAGAASASAAAAVKVLRSDSDRAWDCTEGDALWAPAEEAAVLTALGLAGALRQVNVTAVEVIAHPTECWVGVTVRTVARGARRMLPAGATSCAPVGVDPFGEPPPCGTFVSE